ncbi:MAG: PrgI family protein [Patescibacteria group bacterium]
MQFRVPQFLETEDKIVGPLTLRQFLYIGAAFVVISILYALVAMWLWAIISLFIVILAGALAFGKVNGQPMSKIILAGARFYWKPQTYVWQEPGQEISAATKSRGSSFSLERIMAGLALKTARHYVETGSLSEEEHQNIVQPSKKAKDVLERYQVLRKMTGEKRAARRIDYR